MANRTDPRSTTVPFVLPTGDVHHLRMSKNDLIRAVNTEKQELLDIVGSLTGIAKDEGLRIANEMNAEEAFSKMEKEGRSFEDMQRAASEMREKLRFCKAKAFQRESVRNIFSSITEAASNAGSSVKSFVAAHPREVVAVGLLPAGYVGMEVIYPPVAKALAQRAAPRVWRDAMTMDDATGFAKEKHEKLRSVVQEKRDNLKLLQDRQKYLRMDPTTKKEIGVLEKSIEYLAPRVQKFKEAAEAGKALGGQIFANAAELSKKAVAVALKVPTSVKIVGAVALGGAGWVGTTLVQTVMPSAAEAPELPPDFSPPSDPSYSPPPERG